MEQVFLWSIRIVLIGVYLYLGWKAYKSPSLQTKMSIHATVALVVFGHIMLLARQANLIEFRVPVVAYTATIAMLGAAFTILNLIKECNDCN